ncbi:protein ELYS-like [Ruditapes philippinarum]|uniref:protein ELYS-like n=1 Tax=Ruditapes philippinarum TaxID=129788 RepID=UPI00295BFA53|nr:protein ELYS-like [Ruditapes philippinarum]
MRSTSRENGGYHELKSVNWKFTCELFHEVTMRPGVEPHHVSDMKPFLPSTLACLEDQPAGAFSGVFKDGKSGWIVRGSLLEVVDISTSKRCAAWQFGRILSDEHTNVTCVEEFRSGQTRKLLVGVCNASPIGLICVFDVALSKVIKAVEIPHPVTEVEVVSNLTGNLVPSWALSEHLRYFCGLVAVGTNTGQVYLVDMCTDDSEFFSDEEVPSKLHFISPRIRDIENQRFHCMSQGLHLAMMLNDNMISRNGFEYQKPDGLVMKTFHTDCVTVTCLKYIPQTGILVVGFSFGCYQLWKLNIPVLEYSSRLEPDPMPVTHITYQEPENDPKNFCYIWIARGQKESEDQGLDSVSSISMYQLAFNQKTFYSNYGVYYEELTSVCLRLDHELTSKLVQFGTNYDGGSRVVSCYTLSDPRYQPPAKLDDNESFEESSHGPDLSLCVFVWEATEGNLSTKVGRHLAIFDINRWYHAQMPSSIRFVHGSTDMCAYFCSCRLDLAAEKAGNDSLLMVHVSTDRLRKFTNNSPVPPDQYFYPSSLAFNASLIFESGIVNAEFLGSQREVLASMESKGPAILMQPLDLYNLCVHVGLLPRPVDIVSSNPNTVVKRELLLGLALEYNMISFLKSCITTWAGGEYENHGCTLKFLLDWAWEMVSSTKHKIDSTCVILYNYSGLNLDQRSMQTLILCNQRLSHLVTLFKTFQTQTGPITEQGEAELESKVLVSSLLSHHLSVVLWFVGAGLLPEGDDTEVSLGGLYCYPATSLMTAYKNRRTELQNIHSDVDETNMLMIDGLVETMGVQEMWEREGGTGLYPPPSIHALLSSYLLENCDMLSKQCLVLYLLLDLVSVDSSDENETFSEKVSGFARRFNLPQTLVKLMQAFWLLDHRDFEEALSLMLDPMVRAEFARWQHKRIIKALLYQGDAKMALRYITSVQPALTTPEEVKLKLTVLLANELTAEALTYQRVCRDKNNMNDLLSHLFLGCQQTKTLGRLLQLPLSNEEETILVDYLLASSEPHSQELLVMHYLQRARFVEAIQLNEKLKHSIMTEANAKARERAAARNAIVDSYASLLPLVQRRLMLEQLHVPKKNIQWRREVRRPTPLSTKVTKNKARAMSQSAFIMTIMEKLDEIETEQPQNEALDRSVGPFICTPVTPARRSLRDTPATLYPESAGNVSGSAGLVLNKSLNVFSCDTPTRADNRGSRFFSASCMSMLQTPSVKRVTPKKQRMSTNSAVTPQSILKVRNMIATTSPSPHSSNVTPNSQELEGSAKKVPRKLGYGAGTTPLSSIPRHIAGDRSLSKSQPSSPKSVSFLEPSSAETSSPVTPIQSRLSQPTTPKSVSFMDKSASKLQPMSTPKQLRFSLKETSILLGSSKQSSPKSPTQSSPRSIRDRSPTPESSEKSPKFSENLDQLHRRPLHSPPKDQSEAEVHSAEEDGSQVNKVDIQTDMVDYVVSNLEQSDENISDEEVEEMDESYTSGIASSVSGDISISSVATVREVIASQQSPESVSPSKSPTKLPSSPTVKVSKSPVSKFTSSEPAQSEITSTEHAQTGSQEENDFDKTGSQNVHIDLTEEDEMEVDQSEKVEDKMDVIDVKKTTEIFEQYEEINAPAEIEEMETVETVSSSADEASLANQSIKQEVEEEFSVPPEPVRHLEPPLAPKSDSEDQISPVPSENETSPLRLTSPVVKTKDSPPDSDYGLQSHSTASDTIIHPSSTLIDNIMTMINDKFGESPVLEEEDVQLRAKVESEDVKEQRKATRTRRKFDLSPVKIEQEPVTPTRRTRQKDSEVIAPPTGQVTPTRSTRRTKKIGSDEEEEAQEVLTPRRSTRSRQKKESESSPHSQAEASTPTRSSRRLGKKEKSTPTRDLKQESVTPTRSSNRSNVKKEVKPEKLEIVSAISPKPFSPNAKEAIQESLLQISAEMKARMESPENKMTQIKDKPVASPPRTPTRSRKKVQDEFTPPRMSTRTGSRSEVSDNDENVPGTSGIGVMDTGASPAKKSKKATTPRRGQKKAEDVERQNENKNDNRSDSHSADIEDVKSAQIKKTPTRGRRKKEDPFIEITSTVEPKTPPRNERKNDENMDESRRDSFGRSEIPEVFEDIENVENTPTRRQTLSRSCKKSVSNDDVIKTPTRRQSLGREGNENENNSRTPTRRRSIGRETKIDEEIKEDKVTARRQSLGRDFKLSEETLSNKMTTRRQSLGRETETFDEINVKTPTRRQSLGRSDNLKKEEKLPEEDNKSDLKSENIEPLTPSRRGRPKKKTEESKNETENQDVVKTPSRRGKGKKALQDVAKEIKDTKQEDSGNEKFVESKKGNQDEEGSPASHTRSHDVSKKKGDHSTLPDVFDIQNNSFQFSDPMQVDSADSAVAKSFTPVKSFIFSPPITHTRSVIQKEDIEASQTEAGILLPPGRPSSIKQVSDDLESKPEKKSKRKTKRLYKEREEILLISPITGEQGGDSGEEGRGIMTRSTRAASKKVQTKKDGTKLLLQSLPGVGRKTRTSHRLGPLGQKKSEK